jgi:uncharacterized protein (TIRG00374 family)
VPGEIAGRQPALPVAGLPDLLRRLPAPRLALDEAAQGRGYKVKVRDGTEILFISWLVNCVVPAKLGDLYRAYLLKLNSPVSATKTLGTVFMERILDLVAIAALGIAAGYWQVPGTI